MAHLVRRPMVRDTLGLYVVTIVNALLPLVLIPHLARALQPEAWGTVLFAQATAAWIAMLVEYGFSYSAAREVARHRDEPDRVRLIVAEMMGGKLLLSLLAGLGALMLWRFVPCFRDSPLLLLAAVWSGTAQGLSPMSYFQGVERLLLPAALSVVCRILFVVSVFVLIHSPDDGTLVILLQALSATLSLSIQIFLVRRQTGASISAPGRALAALRQAWPFFLFVAIAQAYANANSLLLGLMAAASAVSFYGGPERLMRGVMSLTSPINQVLYPRLSSLVKQDVSAARHAARKGTLLVTAIGVVLGLGLSVGAPWFVAILFGTGYEGAVPVLRVIGLVCPFAAVSGALGARWMFPLGMERLYNRIAIGGALLDVALAVVWIPSFGALGAACAVLAAEVFIAVTVFALLWRRRLNPFQHELRQGEIQGA